MSEQVNMSARYEHEIPEGYEARIEDNKVIIELKESEDERIIRILKEGLEGLTVFNYTPVDKILAWLEEQKEQKPIFRVGDTMRTWDEAKRGITDGLPHIISINSTDYLCDNEAIRISDQGDYEFPPMNRKPAEWSEEDIKKIRSEEYTKGFNDAAFGYKQEWSGEDEGMLNCIIATLCEESHGGRETNDKMVVWLENRLKSLRPQPHWKPTTEQMNALLNLMRYGVYLSSWGKLEGQIESLYGDLTKL